MGHFPILSGTGFKKLFIVLNIFNSLSFLIMYPFMKRSISSHPFLQLGSPLLYFTVLSQIGNIGIVSDTDITCDPSARGTIENAIHSFILALHLSR